MPNSLLLCFIIVPTCFLLAGHIFGCKISLQEQILLQYHSDNSFHRKQVHPFLQFPSTLRRSLSFLKRLHNEKINSLKSRWYISMMFSKPCKQTENWSHATFVRMKNWKLMSVWGLFPTSFHIKTPEKIYWFHFPGITGTLTLLEVATHGKSEFSDRNCANYLESCCCRVHHLMLHWHDSYLTCRVIWGEVIF